MSIIKKCIKKIRGYKYDTDTYVEYLRGLGVKIGNYTKFYNVEYALVDITQPYLIEIGDNVKLTKGITILTHDYAWSVLKNKYGNVLGSSGKVIIGNNVFVGVNTTILKGANIGDNVIIGAGSVVAGTIPPDCVAVGAPAKPIMSLDEYYYKRLEAQDSEAKELVKAYRERFGRLPDEKELSNFFWLFTDYQDPLNSSFEYNMNLCGTSQHSWDAFKKNVKKYKNFSDFLNQLK